MAKKPIRQKPRHYFKEWRKFRGLTQADAADDAGMSESNLSLLENSKQDYTATTLEALARVYNCSPADLLERDPGNPDSPEGIIFSTVRGLDREQLEQMAEIAKTFKR